MRERPPYVRQLAAEMELLSHGATASWNPAGGAGVPASRAPSGESKPMHEEFLADWDKHGDRVLEKWNERLKAFKGGGKARPVGDGSSEDEWILKDGEGQPADVVAQRFRCTPTRVRRLRVSRGLDAETGKVDLRGAVRELREAGKSYREIGSKLGRSKSQIERVDKKEAA